MMKRKILLILLLALAVQRLSAQDLVPKEQDKNLWKTTLPTHEFQLGVGDAVWPVMFMGGYLWAYDLIDSRHKDRPQNWFDREVHYGKVWTAGAYTFSYQYRICKFLWLGGDLSYTGSYSKVYDSLTGECMGNVNSHVISLMPKIRFSYLNRKYVTLYSGFSLGVGVQFGRYSYDQIVETQWHLAGQLTILGVKAGTNWFGFCEIGYGHKGFGTIGVGYNFNNKYWDIYKRDK